MNGGMVLGIIVGILIINIYIICTVLDRKNI